MARSLRFRIALLLWMSAWLSPAEAGIATPHRISYQGQARNAAHQPVLAGDVTVRIYNGFTGGTLVYDSGTEFTGAISAGVFSVLLGGGAPLLLDNTREYYLELDINGTEVVGDAASGRQAFWPGGGDHSRADLESRIASLEAMIQPSCAANTYNLNGNPTDGCEFTLDPSGIYVDANDPSASDNATSGLGPVGTCANCQPCLTIAFGLGRAVATGRSNIYVANGTYSEAVNLTNGKNLRGGYRGGTWERQLNATATILRGESVSGNHKRAIVGLNITSPTMVEGFVVFGPAAAAASGNSYAVHLSNAGGLTLASNVIVGGTGGPGPDGAAGAAGTDGLPGGVGADGLQSATSNCPFAPRPGGAGGMLSCIAINVNGGAGGGNRCTPVPGSEYSGLDGSTATGVGGGAGGDAGDDVQLQGGVCSSNLYPVVGAAGGSGAVGSAGPGGAGSTSPAGTVVSGHWLGGAGGSGASGGPGRGGGGGGAGGGADGISPDRDVLGGAGGGGGSGACGSMGGAGGGAAGGAFGVFIANGAAPVIQFNTIIRGYGGPGGRGGVGGKGGAGGTGGTGGAATFFCAAPAGHGGDGGQGGHGGGGGGAAGGMSCGIYGQGIGLPNYGSNVISGGAAGAGGVGGPSLVNPGTAGAAGVVLSVSLN